MKTATDILEDLRAVIATFENRDYSGDITADTRFFADLGFVSIDAVVLGERLEAHFQRPLPFPKFLSELAERNVSDIQVGELAEFLAHCLNEHSE